MVRKDGMTILIPGKRMEMIKGDGSRANFASTCSRTLRAIQKPETYGCA